ncbi:ATP-binding protein [Croceivirga thetidis]|uniref:DNA polymerase III subunit delta n=1 Tax=Croceivirga thetidis TaxID=2721623 RepID=A0ABX1GMS2_9FLAO|nr:DNA polymerase III subunit delta' [Croceivirga thetidis]NKI31216.1 DNA polymerase III subunit delta' [Croceivirga thetidis]
MLFGNIIGQEHIKKHLVYSVESGRVPHAQLFVGPEGCGTLPMAVAYAQYVLCNNKGGENSGQNETCNAKCNTLSHPDVHFVYPVANSDKVKSHAVSDDFISDWREFLTKQPYGNLFDWYRQVGIEKKQGQIGVDEAQNISKKLALKSYEGGYKVLVIWMAEKMNGSAANKLLKLIEEPPNQTLLLLIAENEENIINTIRSRCQVLHFDPIPQALISKELEARNIEKTLAEQLAHEANGNLNKALDLAQNDSEDLVFEKWFVHWVRSAFKAKGNKSAIHDLILWSEEVAKNGRETQKNFLKYCEGIIRQALLTNYGAHELVYAKMHTDGFDLAKFAPFIHENNILQLTKELETAHYHIERNGNAKLVFTDLSIKLTRLLHVKAA